MGFAKAVAGIVPAAIVTYQASKHFARFPFGFDNCAFDVRSYLAHRFANKHHPSVALRVPSFARPPACTALMLVATDILSGRVR